MLSKCVRVLSVVMVVTLLAVSVSAASTQAPRPDFPAQLEQPVYPAGYHPPAGRSMQEMALRMGGEGAKSSPAGDYFADDGLLTAQAAVLGKPGKVLAYAATFGETESAYFADFEHTYGPNGLAFAETGELYVVEEAGARLIKFPDYNSWSQKQDPVWSVGKAGLHDWGSTGLNFPRDVVVSPDGGSVWVADSDIISQFDAETGEFLQRFPEKPWEEPDDSNRFGDARGLAFDSEGHLYVSDMKRQRIQVYSFDPGGKPVYETTVGWFDSPSGIAIDGEDTLYVTDVFTNTVKACVPDQSGGWPWSWDCSVFYGIEGQMENSSDNVHLGLAFGLGVNRSRGVIYIADGWSGNVVRCTINPHACAAIIQGQGWVGDVAVDPIDSTLAVSDAGSNALLRFYGEENVPPGKFTGDSRSPYLSNAPENEPYDTDDLHFNMPVGVDVDAQGNIYLVEENGQRLTKLDKNGALLWNWGDPGLSSWDDLTRMDNPKAVAVDKRNIVIVGGGGPHVRLYNGLTGEYLDTLDQGDGDGAYQFRDVFGVATDSANNIYVSDQGNNRVMVYSYSPTATGQKAKFLRQVGAGGGCGNNNYQFCNPRGIFVDTAKNLYVADHDNCRVQMYNGAGVYKKTFGNGMCRDTFASLGGPTDVAVDAQGRVYVAEEWNGRVNVYEKTGAYLATAGGTYGSNTGNLRNPRAVAVDKAGFVYVADSTNARVQKYAPSVPYWTQVNINGFGNRRFTQVWTLGIFKGALYAGGVNDRNEGTIWKRVGTTLTPVMADGFEDGANTGIDHLLEYKGYLYASTASCTNEECTTSNGGQLWRSADGLDWQMVARDGFYDPGNAELYRMAVLNGKLCVSTWRIDGNGGELWCSASGEIGTWERIAENGFGAPGNTVILSMLDYKPPIPGSATYSFASTLNAFGFAQVWRKAAGNDEWQPVQAAWPDDGRYAAASAMAVYKNYLYVVLRTMHVDGLDDVGATIYRCQKCDGTDWSKALPDAMEDPASNRGYGLEAATNGLYAFFGNREKGIDILYSKDGVTWSRPFLYGLGSSSNWLTYWDNAILWWKNNLYLGFFNYDNGAGVWKLCPATAACK